MGTKQLESSRAKPPGEIRDILSRWQDSGMSILAFAQREGIAPGTLYGWRERFLKQSHALSGATTGTQACAEPTFLPVKVMTDTPAAAPKVASPPLELVVSSTRTLRIPEGFDEPTLRRLLRVLDGEVSC